MARYGYTKPQDTLGFPTGMIDDVVVVKGIKKEP